MLWLVHERFRGDPGSDKPDVRHLAFLGTSRSGLGHLRRISNIVRRLRERAPNLRIRLISNAVPDGLDDDDLAAFSDILICERSKMAALVAQADIDLSVLDTMQLPGMGSLSGKSVLILRETPEPGLGRFRRDDGRPWDCVILPNPAEHWIPGLGADFARRVEAVGWIVRPTGSRQSDEASTGVVLATGGGGTEETRAELFPLLSAVIASVRLRAERPIHLRQAIGPRGGGATLDGVSDVFDPGSDLNKVFRAADLVISTAGYNSVLELAGTDTPALIVPIARSLDDQARRARLWGPKLGFGLTPACTDEAAAWLADQLDRPRRRPPVDLGSDGAVRAAELLLEML